MILNRFTNFANSPQAKYLWSALVVLAWIYLALSWRPDRWLTTYTTLAIA